MKTDDSGLPILNQVSLTFNEVEVLSVSLTREHPNNQDEIHSLLMLLVDLILADQSPATDI